MVQCKKSHFQNIFFLYLRHFLTVTLEFSSRVHSQEECLCANGLDKKIIPVSLAYRKFHVTQMAAIEVQTCDLPCSWDTVHIINGCRPENEE